VVGLPFVLLLMRALSRDEKAHAVVVDAELDTAAAAESESAAPSALWWENDPQLRDRFRRASASRVRELSITAMLRWAANCRPHRKGADFAEGIENGARFGG